MYLQCFHKLRILQQPLQMEEKFGDNFTLGSLFQWISFHLGYFRVSSIPWGEQLWICKWRCGWDVALNELTRNRMERRICMVSLMWKSGMVPNSSRTGTSRAESAREFDLRPTALYSLRFEDSKLLKLFERLISWDGIIFGLRYTYFSVAKCMISIFPRCTEKMRPIDHNIKEINEQLRAEMIWGTETSSVERKGTQSKYHKTGV